MTRGQFSTDPYKLRDAIEFSLARNKISKNTERKSAENYRHLEEQGVADLQNMKDHEKITLKGIREEADVVLKEALENRNSEADNYAAATLKDAIDQGKKNLSDAKAAAEKALKEARKESADQNREKDLIIAWMGGGYSVEKMQDKSS